MKKMRPPRLCYAFGVLLLCSDFSCWSVQPFKGRYGFWERGVLSV